MTRFHYIPLLVILLAGCRTVRVNVTPAGAEIKINDETLRPPVRLSIYPFLPRNLSISAYGCTTINQKVTFSSPSELDIVMNRQFNVNSNPPDANILLNGIPKGKTPITFELPCNLKEASLSFRKEGFIPRNITISPANPKTKKDISPTLVPKATGLQNWIIRPVKYGRAIVFPLAIPEKSGNEQGNIDLESVVELEGRQIQILGFDLLPGQNALLASVLMKPQLKSSGFSSLRQYLREMQSTIVEAKLDPTAFPLLSQLDSILAKTRGRLPEQEARLIIIPLDKNEKQTTITTGNIDIAPTSDGHNIFFASNRTGRLDLWKCNLDDDDPNQNLHLVHSSDPAILTIKLSPDGNNALLTIYKSEAPDQPQIWLCPVQENKHIIPSFLCDGKNPVWSPDGKRIAFQKSIPPEIAPTDQSKEKHLTSKYPMEAIFQIESDGSFLKQLSPKEYASFQHPAWSPDGKRIAFSTNIKTTESNTQTSESQLDFHICVMDADGKLTHLTSSQAIDDMPVWAPDGKSIYFRSNRNLHWGIWKVQVPPHSNKQP